MRIVVYSPGGVSIGGDYWATFQNIAPDDPAPITDDLPVSIADSSLVLHASSYDPASKLYTIPFTIKAGSLDGSHLTIGLYLLLGTSTDHLKLLTIERDVPIPYTELLIAGAILFAIYLITR